ncbi:MAG: hypothetical protein V7K97_15810 [Nostoc sp.]|uniref:hypothetical protein n=1 Tax=Nostoc sp. TaxID=1180 RepID=UPI002FF9BDBD
MKKKPVTLRVAKNLALFELQDFIDFLHAVDPELNPDELTSLTAFVVHSLPKMFTTSPEMLNLLKEIAQAIKNQRK